MQSSANVLNTAVNSNGGGANGDASQTQTNLNNSTASAHLNVYKPTFIINNSYQPGQAEIKTNDAEDNEQKKKKKLIEEQKAM